MILLKQLRDEITKLEQAAKAAVIGVPDPLYIAWMVEHVFDCKAPQPELQKKFAIVMNARRSTKFRAFWNQYKQTKAAISNFQSVNMGPIAMSTREKYRKIFAKTFPGEVPF